MPHVTDLPESSNGLLQTDFPISAALAFSYIRRVTKQRKIPLDFTIDRLTNSIQNTISGDSFDTDVVRLVKADLKQVAKTHGWNFNWNAELNHDAKEVYKLIILSSAQII